MRISFFLLIGIFVASSKAETPRQESSWWNSLAAIANFKATFEQSVEDEQIFEEIYCDQLFSTPTQRRICRANVAAGNTAGLVTALDTAVRLALRECKEQFKGDRWNCPLEWDPSLWTEGFSPESVTFLQQGTRESAFVIAAISAAMAHTVAYACSIGNLTDCSCQGTSNQRQQLQSNIVLPAIFMPTTTTTTESPDVKSSLLATATTSTFQWGGCSENVQFGSFLSRKFLDPPALERIRADANDLLAVVQLQNLQFGRKTLSSQLRVNCRCHGLSASCSVKTCFRQPSSFRQVAIALREKYEKAMLASERPELKAVAVAASSTTVLKALPRLKQQQDGDNNNNNFLTVRNRLMRRKAKEDSKPSLQSTSTKNIMALLRGDAILRDNLIHFKKSPNFCEPSPDWPIGTRDRPCSKPVSPHQQQQGANSLGERLGIQPFSIDLDNTNNNGTLPSCSVLCCGRGYNTKVVYVAEKCRCTFKWCCEIKCETCWTTKEIHTCK